MRRLRLFFFDRMTGFQDFVDGGAGEGILDLRFLICDWWSCARKQARCGCCGRFSHGGTEAQMGGVLRWIMREAEAATVFF